MTKIHFYPRVLAVMLLCPVDTELAGVRYSCPQKISQACSVIQFVLVRGGCKRWSRWSSQFGVFIYWDANPRVANCVHCIDKEKKRLGKLRKTVDAVVAKFKVSRCYHIYLKEE